MPETPPGNRVAWQPLTPRGIAAFADTTWKRLLLVQLLFALLCAGAAVWFVDTGWYPVIEQAIQQLPDSGEIRSGKLEWTEPTPQLLAEGHFLSIAVDVDHTGAVRSPAHLQTELGRSDVRFVSLFGYADFSYPIKDVGFNRLELKPWWGAWGPPILWITFGLVVLVLLLLWAVVSAVCLLPVWLTGFFANRRLNPRSSWQLSGAALLPGALIIPVTILLYGTGFLDLVQLMAGGVIHLIAGFIYSLTSVFFVPHLPGTSGRRNPFARS